MSWSERNTQFQLPFIRPCPEPPRSFDGPADEEPSESGDSSRGLDHPDRLADLFDTGLMDSAPEPGFDRLTRLTSKLLDAPISLVSLVDSRRQYFKSQVGLPPHLAAQRETPLSHSVCKHVVESDQVLVIGDISQSSLVCNNPVLEEVRMLSYVGVPVRSPSGRALGSLCAIDDRPRHWSEEELDILVELAGAVETEIRLRTELRHHARTREDLQRATQAWAAEVSKSALLDMLRVLLRDAPSALAMLDREMCYVAHSRRWVEDYRLPHDNLVGMCHYDIFPELPDRFRAEHQRVLDGERVVETDESFVRPDGRTEHVAYTIVPWYDGRGEVGGLLILSEVLTEMRQTNRELKATLERGRITEKALNSTVETLVETQRMARIEQWSWEIESGMLHRTDPGVNRFRSNPFPSPLSLDEFLRAVDPGDMVRISANLDKARLTSQRLMETFTVRGKDGRPVYCYLEAVPVWDETGVLVRYIGTIQDQTRRRDLESRLFGEQKLQSLGQMASGIAHDFNNVLSVIRGFADLLSEDIAADSPQQLDLKEIQDAAEQGRRLVQQLLLFVRKEKPGAELIDLNVLIADRAQMLRLYLPSNIVLVLELEARDALLRFNRSQLEQLLLNFVGNAGDAIENGGRVTVRTEDAVVEQSRVCADGGKLAPGRYLCLSILDTGPGIGEEKAARIFEPLFTTKGEGKGTGLGLSVCASLVREARGAIDLESSPGEGARFRVFLPYPTDDEVELG